jgi:hypothetical protein
LVAQQVNAIGTGWSRIDVLPPEVQQPVRAGLQAYVDALIVMYREEPSRAEALKEPDAVARTREELWSRAVAACSTKDGEKARMLLLPSLNEMFDVAETERLARRIHSPGLIFFMLAILALASAVFVGYAVAGGARRNWMYMIGSAATVAVAIYVIIELEFPRLGLLRTDAVDHALVELRTTMR